MLARAPSRTPLRTLAAAACCLAVLGLARAPTRANPALETLGAIGAPNPFTARLLATGAEASYFAPAMLPYVPEGFTFGFFVLSTELDVSLMPRPDGADIGESVYDAAIDDADGNRQSLPFRPLPTADLGDRGADDDGALRSYLTIGLVKRLLCEKLVVGLYALLPTTNFQEQGARFSDEREQFFSNGLSHELYGDRLGMMTVVVGLGGVVTDWLSWGAGFTLGLSTSTVNPVYVPDGADQREILITTDTRVDTTFAPHLALTLTPSERFRIALSLHTAAKSETRGTNRLKFWDYNYEEGEDAVIQKFKFTNGYDPFTIATGASFAFPNADGTTWRIAGDLRWRAWSDYVDRVSERPDLAWSDTVSLAVGGRYENDTATVHLDLSWTPSPVPDQRGAQNFVDEDRVGAALGVDTHLDVLGVDVHGSIGVQVHRLLPRTTRKSDDAAFPVRDEFPDDAYDLFTGKPFDEAAGLQTNNPGWPGWKASGWLLGAGVSLEVGL